MCVADRLQEHTVISLCTTEEGKCNLSANCWSDKLLPLLMQQLLIVERQDSHISLSAHACPFPAFPIKFTTNACIEYSMFLIILYEKKNIGEGQRIVMDLVLV